MQEIKLNISPAGLLNGLSNMVRVNLLNFSKKIISLMFKLINYGLFQYRFLRRFNYTKLNIQNHLLEKASAFFGFTWSEEKLQEKPKRRLFRRKNKDKREVDALRRAVNRVERIRNHPQKNKKIQKNLYRLPKSK